VLLCALAVPALLLAVCHSYPDLARRFDLDFWTIPEMQRQIEQSKARDEELNARWRARQAQQEAFERIADEVAAGRMELLEAASRFQETNHATPYGKRDLSGWIPGDTEEERCCRQVISWVEARLKAKPTTETTCVKARLEQELNEHLRRGEYSGRQIDRQ
jgi:hypothetical protein